MKKVYLITGADSDIGKALIKKIAAPGDEFILRGYADMEGIRELCLNLDIKAHIFQCDLTLPDGREMLTQQMENLPRPTHFVHLPALSVNNDRFKNFDEDRFLKDFNIQVMSRIKLGKAVLPAMAKKKFGRVVFMGTSYVLANPPKNTRAYVTAKSAIVGLAKSLAAEYAGKGVTVNAVSPSMMETKFLQDTSHLIVEAEARNNPMGRNATVDDVTPAFAFLLSDEAGFITGVNLPVTGGSVIE